MLPTAARLTRNQDFRLVVRRGRRAGRPRLVVHVLRPDQTRARDCGEAKPEAQANTAPTRDSSASTRVGFVVSKAVGVAVVRHRVARRLRHLMRDRLPDLPAGTLVVVRALPPAADASSRELGTDIDAALKKLRVRYPDGPDSR
ncbi:MULTISPECIES: ribonuclease P protein component [Saccharopolyspora]|uniref:Ribonuclease P protein component n=2 Tax=Saccharopolyspora TaxID=1835 RepID=A0A4R4VBW8_9PSEU|nr:MULTISPECIES: ribonuclease P protein component [Saccharopolyspora]MBQ0922406.1 ribonuclease P protein component [Saccharopolyspora endophytica]TDD02919.1 ribonuclease P protein component [Saccharopolyspora terrae]